ncbi:CpsD/CapB family tyrosine-protein kinase [Deinococcus sp. KSM4-11]|uniref:CpsD/CapB family tyrosine-protein kinase n=1 Tax=Deinococcus sp. KSM4-11 TaxID=2568654 RepID=UPI0010A3D924|nr:CpsD/CapB family tyrosine-protein kinase [Deinococcus sp. KSM4-11]THF84028.1 CpsD/CapB family tyrosine-protein kinase [Deinococcus sp. KSM4-11]
MHSSLPPHRFDWSAATLLRALRTHAPLILGVALLLAALTYAALALRAPVYTATSSLMSAPGGSNDPVFTTAPPLPPGAVDQALHSEALVRDMVTRLQGSGLDAATLTRLAGTLNAELGAQDFRVLAVSSQINDQQGGTYVVSAHAGTPSEAKILADTAAAALLAWDRQRAVEGITRLQGGLRTYLSSLDKRVASTTDPGRRRALLTARQSAVDRLVQLEQVQGAATGTLSPLAGAVEPTRAASGSPLGRALLVFLAVAVLGTVLVARFRPLLNRIAPQPPALVPGVPELGWLPQLNTDVLGDVAAAERGSLGRALALLRGNVLGHLEPGLKRIVVSAAQPSGTSSVVAALLAHTLADSGQRILLIDAHPGGLQQRLWIPESTHWQVLPGATLHARPAATLASALSFPEGAQARTVAPGVDLLGGPDPQAQGFDLHGVEGLDVMLSRWAEAYDLVVVDAPALSASPDALLLTGGRRSLLLVHEDSVNRADTLTVLRSRVPAGRAGLLGAVWTNVAPGWIRPPARPRGAATGIAPGTPDSGAL